MTIRILRNVGIVLALMSALALIGIYTIGNYALGPFTMYGDRTEHPSPPPGYPTMEISQVDLSRRFGEFHYVSTSVKLFWIVLAKCETPEEAEAIAQRLRFWPGVFLSISVASVFAFSCYRIGRSM